MTNDSVAAPIQRYGGFWIRLVATGIDGFVLGIGLGLLGAITGLDFFADDPDQISWLAVAVQFAVDWLYEAGVTASPLCGTLDKRAVGLRVITGRGERIAFQRGLHDMIAGTVVVTTD
jgi:hypothetical protein